VVPDDVPGICIETQDSLQLLIAEPVHYVDATVCDRWSAVSFTDRSRPDTGKYFGVRKFVDDPGFPPDKVALRASPLRPVVSP
jgi:hypothetical protein